MHLGYILRREYQGRYQKGLKAKEFFMMFYNADCEKIAIENPISSKVYNLPPRSQIIQPYEYGHPYSKKTCLWLKGLPMLTPTDVLSEYVQFVSSGSACRKGLSVKDGMKTSAKDRAKTFSGIAKAMAMQWTGQNKELVK